MAHNIASVFSLQGLRVHIIATTQTTVTLHARSPRTCARCPRCGTSCHVVHQNHRRIVNHGQLNDKLILVQLHVRRFRCPKCCRPFTESLPGITRRRSTRHALTHQLQDAAAMSIKGTAEKHHVAWGSVAGLLDDIHYEIPWENLGKQIFLGIDEHSLRKRRQMVTTVTSLKRGKRSLLTILADDKQVTIIKFLKQIPLLTQAKIWEVCIDMRRSFRSAIEAALPSARIVADPFHVVKLAGEKLEEVRRNILSNLAKNTPRVKRALRTPQEKLTAEDKLKLRKLWLITKPWPNLKLAWIVKEKIRDLYRSRDRASAEKKFALILAYLEGIESKPLVTLRKTLTVWQLQILNHFDHGTSNGFTEGCHTKIKMLKRMSYGFRNRERYRIKMLLGFHSVSELRGSTVN